jgi:hypothetical protein
MGRFLFNNVVFTILLLTICISDALAQNIWRQIIKMNQPITEIGFPFIGDFHFKEYRFVEKENGILKYNYLLAGADIYPNVFLFDSDELKVLSWASFGTRLRVWNKRRSPLRSNYNWESSHAIKTPSFLPAIHLAFQLNHKDDGSDLRTNYLEFSFTHHSNGQDAPTLASQDSSLLLPDDYIYNIVDGDFSSNFLTICYRKSNWNQNSFMSHSYYFKLDGLGSEKFDHDDLHKYVLGYQLRWFLDRFDKTEDMNYSHVFDFAISLGTEKIENFTINKGLSVSLSYHYRLPFSDRIAVFGKYGYMGQDQYNIYLGQSLHYMRIGLSISNFKISGNE